MLKGKGFILYSIMKIALYLVGFWDYSVRGRPENHKLQITLAVILVANNLFRQFYLYERDNLYRYGKISIILDFVLGAYMGWLQPFETTLVMLTPTVFDSVVAYSIYFGGSTTLIFLIIFITIHTLSRIYIFDYAAFFQGIFLSYGLGFILIFIISSLASLQFKERKRISRINEELEQAYKQLLDNASKLQELNIEKERSRMAREIHDTLAHTLTAVVVQMEICKKLVDMDTEKAKAEIGNSQELIRAGLNDVKRAIKALRPQVLESSSLTGTLFKLIQDIEESTCVKVKLNQNLQEELELQSSAEVALFRVMQESITNAIRHGTAKNIDISMADMNNMLSIDISDDGSGCSNIKEGYGLKGITERIKSLGGTVHFSSIVGKGFNVHIDIPYKGGMTIAD